MAMWRCPHCGVLMHTYHVVNRHSSEYGDETYQICTYCGEETNLELMDSCPTCRDGWKRPGEKICDDCKNYYRGILQRIIRNAPPEAQEYMNDLLDGRTVWEVLKCDQ